MVALQTMLLRRSSVCTLEYLVAEKGNARRTFYLEVTKSLGWLDGSCTHECTYRSEQSPNSVPISSVYNRSRRLSPLNPKP